MNELVTFLVDFAGLLPDPDPVAPPGTEGVVTILGWGKWVALIIVIFAIIVAAVTIAVQRRRGESDEGIGALVKAMAAVIIIGSAVSVVGFLAGV